MFSSELIFSVTCPVTPPPLNPSLSHSKLAAFAVAKVWWVFATTWPCCYTIHTSSSSPGGVCTCLYASVCLSEWACVRQTLPERVKKCFFSSWGLAGCAVRLLSAAGNPDVCVIAETESIQIGNMERRYDWFYCGQTTHTNIFSPHAL